MTWEIFVTISHIVGTVLGVGGATFAEIFYLKGDKNGSVAYTVMRVGMIILLLSGFGYLLLLRFSGQEQYIYSPRLWAKLTITLIILINALLLQVHRLPIAVGSAVSLTSWYAALILGTWRGLHAGYLEIIAWYAVAILAVAFLEHLIRKSLDAKV
ncbi:MAG: hypothetical protein U1C57_00365 [Candidatus Doudnabacteria bacterium]|nr:hypothetical protein [bacterium]MDZ4243544.1 hypothetical protein [Candidatus Doudnabacteria bacterium]